MLQYLLVDLSDQISVFNVFRYLTFRTGGAIMTALIFVFLFGPALINMLRIRQGKGQPIRDDGPGLPPRAREKLFRPFEGSVRAGGTGLGLSIVKQILQAHGEQVHVESTLGRGTRFWFELPYIEETKTVEATV